MSFKMCKKGKHSLVEIFSSMASNCGDNEYVVRWCSNCGAIVVDLDFDGRTNPGAMMKIKFPEIAKGNKNEDRNS